MDYKKFIKENDLPKCDLAVILGSGLGDVTQKFEISKRVYFKDIESMPNKAVRGHKNAFAFAKIDNKNVVFMEGRIHSYKNYSGAEMSVPYEFLHELGVKTAFSINATASLKPNIKIGDCVLITDHINFAPNPLISLDSEKEMFIDMCNAYDKDLIQKILQMSKDTNIKLHKGIYGNFSGPSYETPAEIKMARKIGCTVVGMSGAIETLLLKYFGIKILMMSVVANYGAGMTQKPICHTDVLSSVQLQSEKIATLIKNFVKS